MIIAFYIMLIVSVLFYVGAFSYETWVSIKRLSKTGKSPEYLHATWEITHTVLVLAVSAFFVTHSAMAVEIAKAAFVPLFVVMFAFIIRATLYLTLFYGREGKAAKIGWMDYVFMISHIVILGGLIVSIANILNIVLNSNEMINATSIGWYTLGLVSLLLLCGIPLFQLYRGKKN